MKYQQKVFGGQASWKMAIRKPKNMKQNSGKWNLNNNSTSYKPCYKQEQGNAYGSMKGRLRIHHNSQQNTGVLEPRPDKSAELLHEKVEDLSRFEMVYPSNNEIHQRILESRINEQDDQIAYLEDEGTSLRERADSMEQEIDTLKLRMRVLEGANAFRSTGIFSAQASFA